MQRNQIISFLGIALKQNCLYIFVYRLLSICCQGCYYMIEVPLRQLEVLFQELLHLLPCFYCVLVVDFFPWPTSLLRLGIQKLI